MLYQPPIPPDYAELCEADLVERIDQRRRQMGSRLVILGHHYQQDDVIRFADFTGDSLKLAQIAARQKEADYIVFCGVHFMAESADMLTDESVAVILPDLSAGCSMADMAEIEQVEDAWDMFSSATGEKIIPITYVNSAANIKAFCGDRDGACCTSSNASMVLKHAFEQGQKILFLPDQHLGRNTAYAMGIPLEQMVLYDPQELDGGLTPQQIRDAKVILWKGHCSVHLLFTADHCAQRRATDPDIQIIVHPECDWSVVQEADQAGSTEYIIRTIQNAPAGSKWAVGTEINLVNRLASMHPDKAIQSLATVQCLCTTMYRIDPKHLLWSLDELAAGRTPNKITVPAPVRRSALIALERMLSEVSKEPIATK